MKQSGNNGTHMIDIIFTLALFCVFAASALMIVLIGANVYKTTVDHMGENFNTRTSITYISTKVRQNDAAGDVYIGEVEGQNALVLEQTIGEHKYITRIYCYNGQMRELFSQADAPARLTDGQVIMENTDLTMEQTEDNMLRFTCVDSKGRPVSLLVAPRCA